MSFTRVTSAGIGSTGTVLLENLNVTGVGTFGGSLAIGGTVSIAGTLTYEDVTNVDAVGLITARNGIEVSGGQLKVINSENTLGILSSTNNGANLDLFDDDTHSRIRTVDGRLHLYADFNNGVGSGNVADSSIRFFVDGLNEAAAIDSNYHFYFRNDSDTYFHRPAANTFAFVNGGSESIRIDSNGRIGIRTDTMPTSALSLAIVGTNGSSEEAIVYLGRNEPYNSTVNNEVLGSINFSTRDGYRGTSISCEATATWTESSTPGRILFKTTPASSTTPTEVVRIESDGKVGIGQATPAGQLHISSGTSGDCELIIESDTDGNDDNDNPRILLRQDGGIDVSAIDQRHNQLVLANSISNNGGIVFETGSTNGYLGATERMRIATDGKVGIGTDNPQEKLHISGGANSAIFLGDPAHGYKLRANVTSANDYGFLIEDEDGIDLYRATSSTGTTNANTHIFSTAGTSRLEISASGYVSGNVNVPAWFGSQDTQHNITTGTWTTLINLGNDVVNPSMNDGGWSESTGIFTVQSGQAGVYFCYAGGGIDDVQDADIVRVGISKNNGTPSIFAEQRCIDEGVNVVVPSGTITQLITVAVGDTLRAKIYHNEGTTEATEPVRCFFGGYRIST